MASLFVPVFLGLFGVYLLTISPTVSLEDGGEMIREALGLGLTHPPGYPLYLMAARLAACLPAGDPAFRVNLLSALSGAAACGVAAAALFRALEPRGFRGALAAAGSKAVGPPASLAAAVFAAAMLGTGYSTWWQSVIAEKYAFNLLMASLVFAAVTGAIRDAVPPGRGLALVGLAYGMWAGHHGQAIYFLPAVLYACWRLLRRTGNVTRGLALLFLAALAGLSTKLLYSPIRAAAHPMHGWVDPSALAGYASYQVASGFQWLTFFFGPAETARRMAVHAVDFIPHQFGWVGTALAVVGAFQGARRSSRMVLAWGSAALFGWVFCASFHHTGAAAETYCIPVFLLFAYLMAEGVLEVTGRFRKAPTGWLCAVVLGALVVANAASHRGEADRSRHFYGYDHARNVLASVPGGSILLVYGDVQVFPHYYVHDVLGYSPSVIAASAYTRVSVAPEARPGPVLLQFPPERSDLQGRFPLAARLLAGNPGLPVYLADVFEGMEGIPVVPCGQSYLVAAKPGERQACAADGRRFPRRLSLRGVFTSGPLDENTQNLLSTYVMGFYRRGRALAAKGRAPEALSRFREALSWPRYRGTDLAAIHWAAGGCLEAVGDLNGALQEYENGLRYAPSFFPLRKALESVRGRR